MPLDERALRRPEFVEESVPIALCDGQEWYFPVPPGEFFPVTLDGDLAVGGGFGPGYDAKLQALAAAWRGVAEAEAGAGARGEHYAAVNKAVMALGIDLLLRNYDLDVAQVGTLLRFRPRDPANAEMWRQVADAAKGITPPPKA
jgi:hypothetical protein